jgi:hypothetical protein
MELLTLNLNSVLCWLANSLAHDINKMKLVFFKRFASWGKMEKLMNLLGRNRKKKDWKLSFARLIIVCWFVEVGRFSSA